MNYIILKDKKEPGPNLSVSNADIFRNKSFLYLHSLGYEFYNFSSFPVMDHPPGFPEVFLPEGGELVSSQTLLNRLKKDLGFHLITSLKLKWAIEKELYMQKDYNEEKIRLTVNAAKKKQDQPKFIFTHLNLPHFPYYFDKNGHPWSTEKLQEGQQYDQKAYLEYLQYANGVLLNFIDEIRKNSSTPPIIILYSDHGYRHFKQPVNPAYQFMNLTAIYLPSGNYSKFYTGMSNVNLMRVLFNTQFNQQLSLLKDDSTSIFPLN